jgi:large repetitive protein
MTDKLELDRLLGAFFVEGTEELADRVIDAALDEIDHTQQRSAWRIPRRFSPMNTPTRTVAAAVIGVLAVGASFLMIRPDRPAVGGSNPTPDVSRSASQSSSPSTNPSLAVVPPRAPAWTSTGDLVAPHGSSHTAALLPDGKVLLAGGFVGYPEGFTASAELYDPGTGAWTATGSMTHGRGGTATLLPDGRVLVAGWDGGDAPKDTELYDPSTGTWSPTGRMIDTHSDGNTATLLPDGRVLVTGSGTGENRATAETYDPATGKWTATEWLIAPDVVGSATLLLDGKVLVVGFNWGVGDSQMFVAVCELYDPNAGTWTATGKLLQPRAVFTATLLQNGKVLVAGGGGANGDILAAAELYDPHTGTWAATGTMIEGRSSHTATMLPDGMVLVAGGRGRDPLASAELYDPETGTWSATASMADARAGTATLLRDGKVLWTGDSDGHTVDSAELYDSGGGN